MKNAADVMNCHFFHASPSDTIPVLLQEMAGRGLGSVPVLDSAGRPLGVATTAEIERCLDMEELIDGLEHAPVCIDQNAPIEIAARALARQPSSSLIIVDAQGTAVGALSPVELLEAVLGVEPQPEAARDHERDELWDRADIFDLGAAHRAPEGPGIILLSPGLDERKRRRVWAESTDNLRERLDQMLREPQDDEALESMLEVYPRTVRLRWLPIGDGAQRARLAEALCNVGRKRVRAPSPVAAPPGSAVVPGAAPAALHDS